MPFFSPYLSTARARTDKHAANFRNKLTKLNLVQKKVRSRNSTCHDIMDTVTEGASLYGTEYMEIVLLKAKSHAKQGWVCHVCITGTVIV